MKKKAFLLGILAALMLPLAGCAQKVKEYRLQVVETLPHDRGAYTQGLFFHNGELYESCGQYGSSSFRKVELKTGKDLRRLNFDAKYFVEGSCVLNNLLYILTCIDTSTVHLDCSLNIILTLLLSLVQLFYCLFLTQLCS